MVTIAAGRSQGAVKRGRWARRDGGPDAGASPPSLQPVEIPAAGALEGGGEGNGLESGQVSEGADI